MRARLFGTLLISAAMAVASAAPVQAASAVAPADGATVSATPTFSFDFEHGFADVELSRTSAIQTAGAHVGEFADRANEVDGFVSDSKLTSPEPIDAGAYYWHAKAAADNDPANPGNALGPWSPVRRMTVIDEPPHLIGWSFGANYTTHTRQCRSRVRLRGKVSYSDNDATPRVRFHVRISSGGRLITSRDLPLDKKDNFNSTICTRHKALKISPELIDRIGQVKRGTARTVHVR